jgi:hypothetical protein
VRAALILGTILAAGCCGRAATSDVAQIAARDNAEAWHHARTYASLWGRRDTPEALEALALFLTRSQAWGAQARAIQAAVEDDKTFDARKAYAEFEEVRVP